MGADRSGPMICATCRRALNVRVDMDGAHFEHSVYDQTHGDGHEVSPVPAGKLTPAWRCDMCQDDVKDPWVLRTRPFSFLGADYSSDWALCDPCAELIRSGRWDEVSARGVRAHQAISGEPLPRALQALVFALHALVRKNVLGPPAPPQKNEERAS